MQNDDFDYFVIESCYQQIEVEQQAQFDRQQNDSQNDQQFIQILDPNSIEDSGFMYLLQESNTAQLEEAMVQDISMFYNREARLYNYITNLFQFTDLDMQGAPEYTNQLSKLLKMFFQIHEVGQHSEFSQLLAQHVGFKKYRYIINSDHDLIQLLLKIILSEEVLNKENDYFSQIRIYLPRFFIFSLNPPRPFVSKSKLRSLQNTIVEKINYELFETNFEKPQKLDLLALSYFSDPELNFELYRETIEILRSTLESLLEQSNNNQQESFREIQNLLQFFLAFTTNHQVLKSFFQINFHNTLYNYIRQSYSIFQEVNPPSWTKDPLIIEQMVSLIARIVSSEQVDKQFMDILHDDFMIFLQQQKLDMIYKVILPILNTEQVQLIPVCFHPKMSIVESKAHTEKFLQNQNKTMAGSTTLVTELLTRSQCDKITQFVLQNLNKNGQKQQHQMIIKPNKLNQQMEEENNDQAIFDLFKEEYLIDNYVIENIQQIPKSNNTLFQQKQNNKIDNQKSVKGFWIHLHSFNPFNPHFDSQILAKVLENRTNVLFIFEMMVGQENVKLVCFVNHLIQDRRRQNYIQARSNDSSFYAMMIQDEHFWTVNALDGKPHVLLDIQQQMVQICHHNEPIACINFSDFQQSKFGFPFQKLQEKTLLMDQINAALQGLECYLLQIGIYYINSIQ